MQTTNSISNQVFPDQRSISLFEISLINKQQRPKIKPLYTGFEELKISAQKLLLKNAHRLSSSNIELNQFYPILWIDYCGKNYEKSPKETNKQVGLHKKGLFDQFQKILTKIVSKKELQSQKLQQLIEQTRSVSSNHNLFVDALPIMFSRQQDEEQMKSNKHGLLIRLNLSVGSSSEIYKIVDDLLSANIFLAQIMIVNCTSIDINHLQQIEQLKQSIQIKIAQIKKQQAKRSNFKTYFLVKNQSKHESSLMTKFIEIKNNLNSLVKVKKTILEGINSNSYKNKNQYTIEDFVKKCEVASRILESALKQKKNLFNKNIFCKENIEIVSKSMEKQQKIDQSRRIRSGFQEFYQQLINPSKKQGSSIQKILPLPPALIKFRIEQISRSLSKQWKDKQQIQKISRQYEVKLLEKNQKQLQRGLRKFIVDYIGQQKPKKNEKQALTHHPQKLNLIISELIQSIKHSYPYLSQEQLSIYVYPSVYQQYYNKLFTEFDRISKIINNGSHIKELEQVKQKNQKLEEQNGNLMEDKEQIRKMWSLGESQKEKYQIENRELKEENIELKYRLQSTRQDLTSQVVQNKQLSKKLQLFQSKAVSQMSQSKQKSITQDQRESLRLQLLQQMAQSSINDSSKITNSFQRHLQSFKHQYRQLEQRIRQKQEMINQKEKFYKEKIRLLEQQLQGYRKITSKQEDFMKEVQKQSKIRDIQARNQQQILQLQKHSITKTNNYQKYIAELQSVLKDKNSLIQTLTQQVYSKKSIILALEDKLEQAQKHKCQSLNKLTELTKSLNQKTALLNIKNYQNLQLTEQANQYLSRISSLQTQVLSLKSSLSNVTQQNYAVNRSRLNSQTSTNSFLKFQKDHRPQSLAKKSNTSSTHQLLQMSSSSVRNIGNQSNINTTPIKKANQRVKTMTDQNAQLLKLLQQRRTIQKKKEQLSQKQNMLQKIQQKIIKAELSLNSSTYSMKKTPNLITQKSANSLIESNFNTDSKVLNSQDYLKSTTVKRLF